MFVVSALWMRSRNSERAYKIMNCMHLRFGSCMDVSVNIVLFLFFRLSRFGIYTTMFLEVLATLLKVNTMRWQLFTFLFCARRQPKYPCQKYPRLKGYGNIRLSFPGSPERNSKWLGRSSRVEGKRFGFGPPRISLLGNKQFHILVAKSGSGA